jgi:5-amino-6-(5-phosphoribosylamino)uracil reductase
MDGYIDDAAGSRLLLSGDADFDAILVGATTIRKDNPRLLVRSRARRDARTARGTTPTPVKVTITGHGDLDAAAKFFAAGDTGKIVYAASPALDKARESVGAAASVVDAGDPVDLHLVLADLHARGIGKLMVEGGGTMHTQFLASGLADELHLAIAPFFVGDARAPRFVHDGTFPWNPGHRARLAGVTQIEDVVLLRYALSDRYDGH